MFRATRDNARANGERKHRTAARNVDELRDSEKEHVVPLIQKLYRSAVREELVAQRVREIKAAGVRVQGQRVYIN